MTSLTIPAGASAPKVAAKPAARKAQADGFGWLEIFVIAQVVLPALLYLPGTQSIRVPIRVMPFALSIAALGWDMIQRRSGKLHPSAILLIAAVLYLITMMFSPSTNTFLAAFGQIALYLAVLAPVIWVPSYIKSTKQFNRVLAILLVCNGVNSCVGIMQVIDPQTWLPKEFSSVIMNQGMGALTYMGPDGREIVRPPGLSDNPGGVCGPAATAAVLALINLGRPIRTRYKLIGLLFAFAGVAAIFLSHVRTSIIICVGMLVVYFVLLLLQREAMRAAVVAGVSIAILAASFFFAVMLGGGAVLERFASLFQDDPVDVYYGSARGYMLQYDTMNYLEYYPMGAGLGRWGMMRTYFGDDNNLASTMLWAEVQYPAWVLDGGIVLLLLYNLALIVNSRMEVKLALSRNRRLREIAAVVVALNAGTLALIFSFTPFTTQVGLQYWLLSGMLYGLWVVMKRNGEVV
jgi:hypothetical protein